MPLCCYKQRVTAVLLLNLGGPDSLDSVEPYLVNLFKDPFLIRLPLKGRLRAAFARWVAHRRAPHVRKLYAVIGGRSPIERITRAQAKLLERFPQPVPGGAHFVFSAPGVPVSIIKKGDPYERDVRATVRGLVARMPASQPWSVSFQSKVGPVKWLEPATANHLPALAKNGVKEVLVVPVAFVSDHIETLHEQRILLRGIAEAAGIERYEVANALNESAPFARALARLVREAEAAGRCSWSPAPARPGPRPRTGFAA